MVQPGNIERGVIGVMAFLMIASGVGALVSMGLREAAFYDDKGHPFGYLYGLHALFIIIPGLVGLFVVFGCGGCNTKSAYIMSLAFDIVGLVLYIISTIALGLLLDTSPQHESFRCTYVQGDCRCTLRGAPIPDFTENFANGCERELIVFACRTALFCMWAFGLLFTIIHLVLVARLSCVMKNEVVTIMLKPGNIQRGVTAAVAFLMIASGVGALVSMGLREAAFYDDERTPYGYLRGLHGIFIIIPGLVGLFVVFGCGCCNTRFVYIMSLVFDIVGLLLYIASIIVLQLLFDTPAYLASRPACTYIQGDCRCTLRGTPVPDDSKNFANGCERELKFLACRTALFCMWAFGLLFTIIHLVLVARLSCVMRNEISGQVLTAPGQSDIPMQKQAPQGRGQVYAVSTSAYFISQPQPTSKQARSNLGRCHPDQTTSATGQTQTSAIRAPVQAGDAQASSLTAKSELGSVPRF